MNKYQSDFFDSIIDNAECVIGGIPMPLEIELSIVDRCNRKCHFCPRSDEHVAPNTELEMPDQLYRKISKELTNINYKGLIVLCGYGEPLLHTNIYDLIESFKSMNISIVTNGDLLTQSVAEKLILCGLKKILVSVYEEKSMYRLLELQSKFPDYIVLRNRYNHEGLKLIESNRAGTLNNQCIQKKCFYPFYMMMIDVNGDVLPCCHDWNRHYKIGNVWTNSLLQCWNSKLMNVIRKQFKQDQRIISPCNKCNINGTMRGIRNYTLFQNIL